MTRTAQNAETALMSRYCFAEIGLRYQRGVLSEIFDLSVSRESCGLGCFECSGVPLAAGTRGGLRPSPVSLARSVTHDATPLLVVSFSIPTS